MKHRADKSAVPKGEKVEREPFCTIARHWPGETCFIVAGGPSLLRVEVDRLIGHPVIAVNRAHMLVPWAEILYFNDGWFWNHYRKDILKFPGQIITPWRRAVHPRVNIIEISGARGLDARPWALRSGGTSVHGAINVAAHRGVARIVLLGLDMKFDGDLKHWHAEHPVEAVPEQFPPMMRAIRSTRGPLKDLGIRCYNATEGSALDAFPYRPLEYFL